MNLCIAATEIQLPTTMFSVRLLIIFKLLWAFMKIYFHLYTFQGVTGEDYDLYFEVWQEFDPQGTQYMEYK